MAKKNAILGTTKLEWHSVENPPAMHPEEYAGERWMQSDPLLLADAEGAIAVGYCQQSSPGKVEFETACTVKIGAIRMWALLGQPPTQNKQLA
jgi:hypothetical protein